MLTKLIGPLVALGNPEDYVPSAGPVAVRMYASDTDWVQKLDGLARQCNRMIVEKASSDNLRLEYSLLKRDGLQEKLFVFTANASRLPNWIQFRQWVVSGSGSVRWQEFSDQLLTLGYDLAMTDPDLGSVITFDADAKGILLTTEADTPERFVEPIS